MKITLLIAALLCIIFGVFMTTGFLVTIESGASTDPLGVDILFLLGLGIIPIAGGIFLYKQATNINNNQ